MADANGSWTLPEVSFVFFGALLLLWQPTFFMNDELAQAVGLHTLGQGRLATSSIPLSYLGYMDSLFGQYSLRDILFMDTVLAGSWMENILALPIRVVLQGMASLVGLGGALGVVAGVGVGAASWIVARRRLAARTAAGIALGVGALLMAGAPRNVAAPFLDVAALQLVTMAATAIAAAFWWHMLRPEGPRMAWFGAALLMVATPMMFWAFQIKYHGLALALQAIAIWCYKDGAQTSPLRTLAAAGVVGLAVWNHPPGGMMLAAAMLVVALPIVGMPGFWRRAGAGIAGGLFGLIPWGLQGWASRRALRVEVEGVEPVSDAEIISDVVTTIPGSNYLAPAAETPSYLESAVWNDPGGALAAMWQVYVWPDWMDVGQAFSMLFWAPWLVLVVATLSRSDLRARVALWPAAVAYCLALPLLAGQRMLDLGAGFDMRHAVTVWPWLVLLAWPALADILRRRPARWWAEQTLAAAMVGMSVLLVSNLLWHKSTGVDLVQKGYGFEGTWLHRHGGMALAAALAGSMAAVRWSGPRWKAVRDGALAWSLASSFTLGIWLRLAAAVPSLEGFTGPMVSWPTRMVSAALRWIGYSY